MIAFIVKYKGYDAWLQVGIFPGAKSDYVTKVYHEGIHAVAFDSKRYCVSFRNQMPDFFHHQCLVFNYCLHTAQKYR